MADTKKTNIVIWDNAPQVYKANDIFDPNIGENPARYLVNPGSVKAPGKHSPGNLRHARPYLVSGNVIFVFPVGVEGFNAAGSATLGLHTYVGANAVAAQTIMRETGRLTLSGTFPGGTAQDAMVNCRNILRSAPPDPGLILYAPGVFDTEQFVVAEDWEFDHSEDDRTHSISYRITFVRVGNGKGVADPHGQPAPTNPTTKRRDASAPAKTFTVRSGVQTFQQIANSVYGAASKGQQLGALNGPMIAKFQSSNLMNKVHGLPTYALPTYRWPVGTKVRY